MFDSWANELSEHDFREFSLPTLVQISSGVRAAFKEQSIPAVPIILFAKGANLQLDEIAASAGYDVLGIDWVIAPQRARKLVAGKATLQGNFDPNLLYGGRESIEKNVKRVAEAFKEGDGGKCKAWIANLGHGITPAVDPEDLRWLLECVHKYSASST